MLVSLLTSQRFTADTVLREVRGARWIAQMADN